MAVAGFFCGGLVFTPQYNKPINAIAEASAT